MKSSIAVELPHSDAPITVKKLKSGIYVYRETGRKYNKTTKHTIPERVCIGKACSYDEDPSAKKNRIIVRTLYPNENYVTYYGSEGFPECETERSSSLSVGAFIAIQHIVEETKIRTILQESLPNAKWCGLALDFAAYEIISESNVAQHYPDYAYRHTLFTPNMNIYSDSTIGAFFQEVDEDHRQKFLNIWNQERSQRKERIYVSYDSSNRHCRAGEIEEAEYGNAKDGNRSVPIINKGEAYDCNNREPLFYESYPGSIVDVSMIKHMIDKARNYNYHDIGFILDRGYFSRKNLFYMDEHGYPFIIMAKGSAKFLHHLVDTAMGKFECNRNLYIPRFNVYGMTVRDYLFPENTDDSTRYIHVYYNEMEAAKERLRLEMDVFRWEKQLKKCLGKTVSGNNLKSFEKYFTLNYDQSHRLTSFEAKNDVIEDAKLYMGYFVIITSEMMTAEKALYLYKSRDHSEKLFMTDKSFLGNSCFRVEEQESKDTKEWIGFIAEIIRNRLYTKLFDAQEQMDSKLNFMTVPQAIRELEKYEISKQLRGTYHIDHPLSATQKTIFNAFGMTEAQVTKAANELSKTLNSLNREATDA